MLATRLTRPSRGKIDLLKSAVSVGRSAGYASLADPPGASVLLPAVAWVEGTLLGTVAASVAIIAVAAVGLMMLSGRVRVRPGLAVILGSFILFGASTIAAGLRTAGEAPQSVVSSGVPPPPTAAAAPAPSATPAANYDPHAGASVPTD